LPDATGTIALVGGSGVGTVTSVGLSSATSGVTIGSTPITTSGTITLAIATASGSQQGLLSSTDWTTFNNKQNALTNPVTGTGTTNYLPKFTGASTIGNSIVSESGAALSVAGSIGISGNYPIILNSVSGVSSQQLQYQNNGTNKWQLYLDTSNNSFNFYSSANTANRLTLTEAGNLGLGVSPSAWASGTEGALQVGAASIYKYLTYESGYSVNAYFNAGWKYINTDVASQYKQTSGSHIWYNAPSGTAGNAISFTQAMTLDASGKLGIGTTSPGTYGARLVSFASSGKQFTATNGVDADFDILCSSGVTTFGADTGTTAIKSAGTTRLTIASTGAATFSSSVTATQFGVADGQKFLSNGGTQSYYAPNSGASEIGYQTTLNFRAFNGNSPVSAMFMSSGGNVGIGTTAPQTFLHVLGSNTSARGQLSIQSNNTSNAAKATWYYDTFNSGEIGTTGSDFYGLATNNFLFYAGGSERMRITSGGNVGIGTTEPNIYNFGGALFTLSSTTTFANMIIASSGTNSAGISLGNQGTRRAEIEAADGSNLIFKTNNANSGTAVTERMRIKSDGIINLSNVPSSSAGLSSGDIYKTVAGVLMIV
jgi:hypothetical protein